MEQKRKTVSPFSNEARNAYVVEHITDSFLTRLKEKPLTDISISELCDAAGVGRTSFYRNFDSREDIVRKYIRRLLTGWKHNWEAEGEESNAKMYGSLFQHLKENADLFLMLKTRVSACTGLDHDNVVLGDVHLPISRKYKEMVQHTFKTSVI